MLGVAISDVWLCGAGSRHGLFEFLGDTRGGSAAQARPLLQAASDVLRFGTLGGASHGCNDIDEAFSQVRRYSHQS